MYFQGSTQLSKSALSKMKLTTLPHDDKTEALSLLRLYHNPNWTVSCLDIQGVLVTVCLICMNVSVTAGTASQTFFNNPLSICTFILALQDFMCLQVKQLSGSKGQLDTEDGKYVLLLF